MSLFPFFKRKEFFSAAEKEQVIAAIRSAEQQTSGEIRLYVEDKNPLVSTLERAAEIFVQLKMQETHHRNAVLIYIAAKHHEVALFGDEGIYKATGEVYWNNAVEEMVATFRRGNTCEAVVQCVYQIGETLKEKFPYIADEDKNELPDDIIFGK